MRLLLDTNIFLEIILDQAQASEAKSLLMRTNEHQFFISDFSLHSIGLFLFRQKQLNTYEEFVDDMIIKAGIQVISLLADDVSGIINAANSFNLDFDDSYQYAIAEKLELAIVSFDRDFDRTNRKRVTPSQIV